MCSGGGGKKSKAEKRAEQEEARRQAAVKAGTAAINSEFASFNDNFFNGRQQAYLDYALPQVDDQFKEARDQLIFALSRSGLTNSSAGAEQLGGLDKQLGDRRRAAVDTARQVANQARQDVAGQKADLLSTLSATFDPASAASGARSRAQFLSSAPTFEPLSELFTLPVALVGDAVNQARFNRGFSRGGTTIFSSPVQGGSQMVVG
jgi:hypothetical protein